MTQEQKDLLLQDLCARLPYGVKVQFGYTITSPAILKGINKDFIECDIAVCELEDIKPYLFPLSSITEEQSKIYHELIGGMFGTSTLINFEALEDFFHKNHIDYRGLIPMGLAIDATNLNIY